MLSANGLVNYFGKWVDLTKINISPILLKKGTTQLALYGLSYIHDNRLARLFLEYKVVFEQPSEETGQWFNLFVCHQNRADRGPKNFLPEDILPDFLHLILWGHEHDCRIVPEENSKKPYYICQPGSSVATSLCEGEAIDKHIGLLEIEGENFRVLPIKLKTVRPFIFDTINLSTITEDIKGDHNPSVKIQTMIGEKISTMIELSKEKLTGDPNQPTEPLIRLRVLYTDEDHMFNFIRFGQQYKDQVINFYIVLFN